jgi:hypothetical protein
MGSVRFVRKDGRRAFGSEVARAEYVDGDGILVSIAVNVDQEGDLYEIDFWKTDFSPLRRYPRPEDLRVVITG